MESLNEAHKLLDRHVQSINKHNEIEAAAHLELDELKTQNNILMKTVENEQQEKKIMEDTLKCDKEEWKQQVIKLQIETTAEQRTIKTPFVCLPTSWNATVEQSAWQRLSLHPLLD